MSVAHGEQVRILEDHGQESGRSMNWWGMVFFISSEALIFANLIAAYLYLEIRNSGTEIWRMDNIVYPAINTVILLSSSGAVHMASLGIRKGNRKQLIIGLAVTIILAIAFLSGQAYEYISLIFAAKPFTLSSSIFGSAFFTLTGFHGLHVTIGAIFLTICLIRATRGHFSKEKHFAVEAAVMYWHFVDVVWVFVFTLVYLVPLLR
jgi:heme/copper-type cytochrome/quinol oxidase subunit 3